MPHGKAGAPEMKNFNTLMLFAQHDMKTDNNTASGKAALPVLSSCRERSTALAPSLSADNVSQLSGLSLADTPLSIADTAQMHA